MKPYTLNGVAYRVWSSQKGYGMSATYMGHLVPMNGDRTLCGKEQGRMTDKYQFFSQKSDCQRCAKKAQAQQRSEQ